MGVVSLRDVPVGTEIVIGDYKGERICWIKADMSRRAKDTAILVSKYVLDVMSYDASELMSQDINIRMHGNPCFNKSNIRQWMSSDSLFDWYRPAHSEDCFVPMAYYVDARRSLVLPTEEGLMSGFMTHELSAICSIRLLYGYELFKTKKVDNRLSFFKKHGVRAHPSGYTINRMRGQYDGNEGISQGSYMSYWLMPEKCTNYIGVLARSGDGIVYRMPYEAAGVRPVITMRGKTQLTKNDSNQMVINASSGYKRRTIIDDSAMNSILGFL